MKVIFKEIEDRIKHLRKTPTDVNMGKISELTLVAIRLQQLLLKEL